MPGSGRPELDVLRPGVLRARLIPDGEVADRLPAVCSMSWAHTGVLLLLFTVGLKLRWRSLFRPEVYASGLLQLTCIGAASRHPRPPPHGYGGVIGATGLFPEEEARLLGAGATLVFHPFTEAETRSGTLVKEAAYADVNL